MAIIAKKINSDMFLYHKDTKVFTQEMSSLGEHSGDIFKAIYDDACDAGFTMVSAVSGMEVTFHFHEAKDWHNGGYVIFNITPESIKRFPHLKNLQVIIYND